MAKKFVIEAAGNGYFYFKEEPQPKRYFAPTLRDPKRYMGEEASYHVYDMTKADLWSLFRTVVKALWQARGR